MTEKALGLGIETDLFHIYLRNLGLLSKKVRISSSAQPITFTNHNLSRAQNASDFDQRPKAIKSLDSAREAWFGSVLMPFHCGLFCIYFFKRYHLMMFYFKFYCYDTTPRQKTT